jgi:phage gp36-like protein
MAYCTQADILGVIPEQELIQLTDDTIPPVMVNAAIVAQAISQAESLINGYIGGRYQLPLVTIPELVKTFALDIVVYKIYLRRKKKAPLEGVKAAYDDAMKQLRDVQSGKLFLGVDQAGTAAAAVTGDGVDFVSGGSTFSRSSLGDY